MKKGMKEMRVCYEVCHFSDCDRRYFVDAGIRRNDVYSRGSTKKEKIVG